MWPTIVLNNSMQKLTVFLEIPFDCTSQSDLHGALTFSHWLPIGLEQGILTEDKNQKFKILLWFDEKSTWWASQPTADELKSHVNINARYVNADIEIMDLENDLLKYMEACGSSNPPCEKDVSLDVQYEKIAQDILLETMNRVNRLIAFARSKKGQYWLSECKIDSDCLRHYFRIFNGRGKVDNGPIFRFSPSRTDVMRITMDEADRYVKESDWPAFREFVIGNQRPKLVGELLAGSEDLLSGGHYRSAITEAVTALELAVNSFARNPNAERAFASNMAQRLSLNSLQSQVKHFGLSGSINYLLPSILSESLLPSSVISDCQFAIFHRQNIVHNGQRSISEIDARRAVSGVRQCCEILDDITNDATTDPIIGATS